MFKLLIQSRRAPSGIIGRFLSRFAADQSGNVLMIVGGAMLILTFALGFGIDYSRAEKIQTKLNAAADAAALLAVDPTMITLSDATAATAEQNLFDGVAATLSGVTITSRSATAVTSNSSSVFNTRTAQLTYSATVPNLFGSILGRPNLTIGGTAQANSSLPANINFYVALDTSPSMLLPTTSAGITALTNATINSSWTSGCDFACHTHHIEYLPFCITDSSGQLIVLDSATSSIAYRYNTSTKAVYNLAGTQIGNNGTFSGGTGSNCGNSTSSTNYTLTYKTQVGNINTSVPVLYADTFWLARNFGAVRGSPATVQLRVDAETSAAQNVITYAQTLESQAASNGTPVAYKMSFYKYNYSTPTQLTLMTDVTGQVPAVVVPDLGLQQEYLYSYFQWTGATSSAITTNDQDTDFTTMFNSMNTAMPTPGTGLSNSTPQEVLMIITDGMADQTVSGQSCQSTSNRGCVQLQGSHITQCNTIKSRGIRIAILYTQYQPSTINGFGLSFANTVSSNNIPYIASQLQACATTNPDGSVLFQQVSTNGDVSAALNALFSQAVQTAHLTQ